MVRFRNLRGGQQEEETPSSDEIEEDEAEAPGQDEANADGEELDMSTEDDEVQVETGDEDSQPVDDGEATDEVEALAGEAGDAKGQGDAALKELAARMSVLQSNLESVQGTRGEIEDKLTKMEERMMRLGSLAEAVSSKYNPFIAENSPDEPSWTEDGAPPEEPEPEQALAPPSAEAPSPEPEPEAPADAEPTGPQAQDLEDLGSMLGEPEPEASTQAPDASTAADAFSRGRPQIGERLEEKFMMLEWVDLMLRRVGRANLLDLLEYYEGLGWLDQGTKSHVIRVAVGMDAPGQSQETKQRGDWRGDLDLHERSLITIERLHGNEISAADVESLRMDMQRFFGE